MLLHAILYRRKLSHAVACCCMLVHAGACCCMLLHAVACYCMLLHAVACFCMLFYAAACCCMLLHAAACCCMLFYAAACCCTMLLAVACRCLLVHDVACCSSRQQQWLILPSHSAAASESHASPGHGMVSGPVLRLGGNRRTMPWPGDGMTIPSESGMWRGASACIRPGRDRNSRNSCCAGCDQPQQLLRLLRPAALPQQLLRR